jgi:hypothetical protein
VSGKVSSDEPGRPEPAFAHTKIDESRGSNPGLVVPRDRIELSTPGFSAARTDVRRCPQKSIIVFTHDVKSPMASGVAHQHPGTKVSAKVSIAMRPQPPVRPLNTLDTECATAPVTARSREQSALASRSTSQRPSKTERILRHQLTPGVIPWACSRAE